ncbi:LPXTG-motif cell wall-anchored protein [Bradyrhizobium sp. GM24.11]
MMAWLESPHWLMIAGALLVGAGSIGLLVSRRKSDEVDPPPDGPIDLPALPFLNSKSKNKA